MPDRQGSVIIVDDDAAVRNALKFSLELEGLDVRAYESAAELLADPLLPSGGCLVVDYYMPAIDGIELIDLLRERQVNLPAILITSKATVDMRRRAARSGIRRVLEKPLSDSALLDEIRAVFANGRGAV